MKTGVYIAIFKGINSLGYIHGEPYRLNVSVRNNKVVIRKYLGGGICPYDSIKLFKDNWKIIMRRG